MNFRGVEIQAAFSAFRQSLWLKDLYFIKSNFLSLKTK